MAYAIIDDPEKHFNTKTYTGNLLQHPVVGLIINQIFYGLKIGIQQTLTI